MVCILSILLSIKISRRNLEQDALCFALQNLILVINQTENIFCKEIESAGFSPVTIVVETAFGGGSMSTVS